MGVNKTFEKEEKVIQKRKDLENLTRHFREKGKTPNRARKEAKWAHNKWK